jgi:uncharacterized protein YcfJ
MNKSAMLATAGGAILVALLLGAVALTSGGSSLAVKSDAQHAITQPATVSSTEANAWAEARAADTVPAYKTYLAAFPEGAFDDEANQAIGRIEAEETAKAQAAPVRATRVASSGGSSGPSLRQRCQAYVNEILKPPSKTTRAATGAAAGCAVGALAGGNDGRNCAIGAVAGGATGYITAGNRERRRTEEFERCMANGGPGR